MVFPPYFAELEKEQIRVACRVMEKWIVRSEWAWLESIDVWKLWKGLGEMVLGCGLWREGNRFAVGRRCHQTRNIVKDKCSGLLCGGGRSGSGYRMRHGLVCCGLAADNESVAVLERPLPCSL